MTEEAKAIVQKFVDQYEDEDLEDFLEDLDSNRGSKGAEQWAEEFYKKRRTEDKDSDLLKSLHKKRNKCLKLLKQMGDAWVQFNSSHVSQGNPFFGFELNPVQNAHIFEEAILSTFTRIRLEKILALCLPMRRAEALFKERPTATSEQFGKPWLSELHLEPGTSFAEECPDLQEKFLQYQGEDSDWYSMDKSLFRILFSKKLALFDRHPELKAWALPVDVVADDSKFDLAKEEVKTFVDRYDSSEFQMMLEVVLHGNLGTNDVEEWAKGWAITLRDNPGDEKASTLNAARKFCLKLIVELVNAWAAHKYASYFEEAIRVEFRDRRLERILSVCLPMDRAQSLYRMKNRTSKHFGIAWYSSLHLDPATVFAKEHQAKHIEWVKYSWNYEGRPSMNKRFFRLLFSTKLGFQSKSDFKRWSMPEYAPRDESSTSITLGGGASDYEASSDYSNIMSELAELKSLVVNGFQNNQKELMEQKTILTNIEAGVNRSLRALALLSVSEVKKCPNLIWMIPAPDSKPKGIRDWITDKVQAKYHLYFVCQHTYTHMKTGENPCVEPPLEITVNRKWLKQVVPAMKLSLMVLKTVAMLYGLPFPIPGISGNELTEQLEGFMEDLMEPETEKMLADVEETIEKGTLDVDTGRISELIGPAYDLVAEKAHDPKRGSEWKDKIFPVIDDNGSTIWVKKEFAETVYSTKRICFPKPDIDISDEFKNLSNRSLQTPPPEPVPVAIPSETQKEAAAANVEPASAPVPALASERFESAKAAEGMSLSMTIICAQGLAAKDRNILGKRVSSDPYVVVELHTKAPAGGAENDVTERIFQTKVMKRTLDPVWNESFTMPKPIPKEALRDSSNPPTLVLRIFDKDNLRKDDSLGIVTVPLEVEQRNETTSYEIPASSARGAKGKLVVSIETKVW